MKDLLTYIVKNLIGDNFEIEEMEEGESRITFIIKVPSSSAGLIIGKEGRIIKAIQNILRMKATLEKKYVSINVEPYEVDNSKKEEEPEEKETKQEEN